MVTRRIDVFDPAVVTIAHITAGTTSNIIPETAELEGTIRTVSETTRTSVHAEVRRVAEGIATAHGVTIDVEIGPGYPVTMNDPASVELVRETAIDLLGSERRLGDAGAADGRRGLLLHPPAASRCVRLSRRATARRGSSDGTEQPLEPSRLR